MKGKNESTEEEQTDKDAKEGEQIKGKKKWSLKKEEKSEQKSERANKKNKETNEGKN